ncbi:DUF1805 domain-containing protein [Paenibacillus sp. SC116]|uniref:YunC family protein n=1 Tax=Paenibacillus sp. SC116 TaxID=2968986 RepID=UPI00215B1F4A|nr:DUF1805 domain-containing protein [Paenibacillus sp. SC116]MCR8843702.1 DUF1805 domain-containing protein [Paenibacillus sp. SC116]
MVHIVPITEQGKTFIGIEVLLPKTTLLVITSDRGYIMCGALDVGLLNEKLKERRILAGRAVGVKTLEQLWEAPLESITDEAASVGVKVGMAGKEAMLLMS